MLVKYLKAKGLPVEPGARGGSLVLNSGQISATGVVTTW